MDEKEEKYDKAKLKKYWEMSYDELVMAPGEEGARLREARFVMQAKVARETRNLGWAMVFATVIMTIATVIMAFK